ncbi:MAG: T9SS type A sorting domain-containing protein [Bacteroidia bacterium]|nr:T9SS type A sorting domain-containing protein [Bacteroidia bacterium]
MKSVLLVLITAFMATSAVKADDIHVRLSPNPASNYVTIELEEDVAGNVTVELFSVIGTRINQKVIFHAQGDHVFTLNTEGIAEGVYLVRVTHGQHSVVKRIKIQPE